ncbi:hypothetical protein X946_5521 [Burkholderia sp. ABCPW 111]|nr:hypothetical protein X946_5521 [Burkholderia sp. ABCPW 111]
MILTASFPASHKATEIEMWGHEPAKALPSLELTGISRPTCSIRIASEPYAAVLHCKSHVLADSPPPHAGRSMRLQTRPSVAAAFLVLRRACAVAWS